MATPSPRPSIQPTASPSTDVWAVRALLTELLAHLLRSGTVTPSAMTEIFQQANAHVDHGGMYSISQIRHAVAWNTQHDRKDSDPSG